MKQKLIFLVFLAMILFTHPMRAEDDGKFCITWLPQELDHLRKDARLTRLVAKYEPEDGAKYYAVQVYSKSGPAPFNYYKVEDSDITLLGQKNDLYPTPFGEFVKKQKIVQALWNDYLNRWIKGYGREGIQKHLDDIAHDVITKEEVDQFTQADFKIPPTMRIFKKRQDITWPTPSKKDK